MSNPQEQQYPEGIFDKFTVEVRFDRETGKYMIYCPEWRCEIAGGEWPGERAGELIDEIVEHNAGEIINYEETDGE